MMRGQLASFEHDAVSPSWEEYLTPINRNWRYIQIKVDYNFGWADEDGFNFKDEDGFGWS